MNYTSTFWALVYAADPIWKYRRGDGPKPLPIEESACRSAANQMVEKGVLVE